MREPDLDEICWNCRERYGKHIGFHCPPPHKTAFADESYAALERQLAEVRAEVAELKTHELLASGYHSRTEREIEIDAVLRETLEHSPNLDSADQAIKDLLELVDAGRNRVRVAEDKADAARSVADGLAEALQEVYETGGKSHAPAITLRRIYDLAEAALAAYSALKNP